MAIILKDKEIEVSKLEERMQDKEEFIDAEGNKEMLRILDLAVIGKYSKTLEEVKNLKRVLKYSEDRNVKLKKRLHLVKEDAE